MTSCIIYISWMSTFAQFFKVILFVLSVPGILALNATYHTVRLSLSFESWKNNQSVYSYYYFQLDQALSIMRITTEVTQSRVWNRGAFYDASQPWCQTASWENVEGPRIPVVIEKRFACAHCSYFVDCYQSYCTSNFKNASITARRDVAATTTFTEKNIYNFLFWISEEWYQYKNIWDDLPMQL